MTRMWRHAWPVLDPDRGFIDLCIEALPDLHAAVADAGYRIVGNPLFDIAETDCGALTLTAVAPVLGAGDTGGADRATGIAAGSRPVKEVQQCPTLPPAPPPVSPSCTAAT